jgi:outer membrane protein assembly factor BamB
MDRPGCGASRPQSVAVRHAAPAVLGRDRPFWARTYHRGMGRRGGARLVVVALFAWGVGACGDTAQDVYTNNADDVVVTVEEVADTAAPATTTAPDTTIPATSDAPATTAAPTTAPPTTSAPTTTAPPETTVETTEPEPAVDEGEIVTLTVGEELVARLDPRPYETTPSGMLFVSDQSEVTYVGIVDGEPFVADLTGAFASVGERAFTGHSMTACRDVVVHLFDVAGERVLAAIDPLTLDVRWQVPAPDGGGSMACGGGDVVVTGPGLPTYGVSAADGSTLWRFDVELYDYPFVDGDLVFAQTYEGLIALDSATGAERWRIGDDETMSYSAGGPNAVWISTLDGFLLVGRGGELLGGPVGEAVLVDGGGEVIAFDPYDVDVVGSLEAPVVASIGSNGTMDVNVTFSTLRSETDVPVVILGAIDADRLWTADGGTETEWIRIVDLQGEVLRTYPTPPSTWIGGTDAFAVVAGGADVHFAIA